MSLQIAIEGCMHGELDNVYSTLLYIEKVENTKIDLLICCGDFQAIRNKDDLKSVNVKPKYWDNCMNSFWKYYSGKETAPIPTIFVGGNHEASNYLWELYYGGWTAPNIYFLGFAGVVKFGDIRIGGLSGIYKARDYYSGHYERTPYNSNDIRSIYHVRQYDVYKLMQIEEKIDIFISHDWPLGITDHGSCKELIQQKPFFEREIRERSLGSKPAAELLEKLKPAYWFSGHLHCKFPAIVQHGEDGPITKFLALDKCLPGRKFLQIIEIESNPGPFEIHYDEEWLAITLKYNPLLPLTRKSAQLGGEEPGLQGYRERVKNQLMARGSKPFEFSPTVPAHDPESFSGDPSFQGHIRNPQIESFLQLLGLPYLLDSNQESDAFLRSSSSLEFRGQNDQAFDNDGDDDDVDDIEALAGGEF
ncbi:lariat debranching enzyme isoform X1 [Amborella trichopoda]|uniref:lariat debranching enzyme isoform X1 n=1 Tax=Amborella trichopoda TaxID=13333 RepID=UPI0009BEAA96|nr:lariat debranching enzyme isoform X1 [Amborella trichopoda]XP_020528150.1 lariat debranching enzyme isoform X1 [Amborella trichopoda]|eukprot:XP_020528149.1 lariat debranching enzyme isoform X1 [Amborella trichopoda]